MSNKSTICALVLVINATFISADNTVELFQKPAVSNKTTLLTAGAGLVAGLATFSFFNNSPMCPSIRTLISATTGGLAAWLMYRYQPEGKYGSALATLQKAQTNKVLNALLKEKKDPENTINDLYLYHEFPLIEAYNLLSEYHKNLSHAYNLLLETQKDAASQDLKKLAKDCAKVVSSYVQEIKDCINTVRASNNWQKQQAGYNKYLARVAKQEAAAAVAQAAFNSWYHHSYCRHHCSCWR